MTIAIAAPRNTSRHSNRRVGSYETREWKGYAATKAELTAALVRERKLLREKGELLQHQEMLAQEFEHRLINGLQMVVSLLSLQSRAAPTVEAAAQLTVAAERVAAFGRVHRRLHLLDHQKSVEFKGYLRHLCDDLADLLFPQGAGRAVVVTGTTVKLPPALAVPPRLHRERADYQFLEACPGRHHRSNGKISRRSFAIGGGRWAGPAAEVRSS